MTQPVKDKNAKVQEIIGELKFLRSTVREVGENFIIRKEGEIEALLGYLAELPLSARRSVAKSWLLQLQGLDCKPAKGRFKDLKRSDRMLDEMLDGMLNRDDKRDT